MNKLLGMLNSMLLAPDPTSAGEGSIYGGAPGATAPGKVAPVVEEGGEGGGSEENFEDGGAEGGEEAGEDFGGEGEEGAAEGEEGGEAELGEDGQPIVKPIVAPKGPSVVKLDAETIAQIRAQQPALPKAGEGEGEPKMTPEQIKQMLNPVTVTDKTLLSMGFEAPTPEQVAGFQNFANETVKNAVSVARLLIQREAKRFEEALGPVFQDRERSAMEAARNDFYKGFGHLKTYDKVVRMAAGEVDPMHENGTAKSKQEIYKEVAAKTIATLVSLGVKVQTPAANLGAGGKPVIPKPNGHSTPGRSGGGNSQSNNKNNPDADIYKRS